MFGWRLNRDKPVEETEEDRRELFCFFDGQKQRAADPLELWSKIKSHDKVDLSEAVEFMQAEHVDEKTRHESFEQVMLLVRDVFGVKPYNEETKEGLTQAETHDVLNTYLQYMYDIKKKHNPSPISSSPSDSTSSEKSTQSPELDSSSTKDESTSDEDSSSSVQSDRHSVAP